MELVNKDAIYLRHDLDVLFVALNPPSQSNGNGHYFSGQQSLFFSQLFRSGLITSNLDKCNADEFVFDGNTYNFSHRQFGVIDLIPRTVQTDSTKIKVSESDVALLIKRITEFSPKIVCIIHSRVMNALSRYLKRPLHYGYCGRLIVNCSAEFYCNYFPNGNPIPTSEKLIIYQLINMAIKMKH